MTIHKFLLTTAACAVLLTGPAIAAEVERTDPQHLAPPPPGGYNLPLAPPVTRFPLPSQWVTKRPTQEWYKAGQIDKQLSAACAARLFRQIEPMRFRALFKGEILGVAFGHGLNLYDQDKRADSKKIYLFHDGDSTNCVVVAMQNEDAQILQKTEASSKTTTSSKTGAPSKP